MIGVKDYDDSPLNCFNHSGGYADIQFSISKSDLPVNLQLFSRDGNRIAEITRANEISFEENRLEAEPEKELIRKNRK